MHSAAYIRPRPAIEELCDERSGDPATRDRDNQRALQVRRDPVQEDGLLAAGLRADRDRRRRAVPHHAAARRRCRRSRGRRRRRIVDRDMDRRLDRSPDRLRALSRQGLSRRSGAEHRPRHEDRAAVFRVHRVRPRSLRAGLDREPHRIDHRQRVRLQGREGAAPGRHAHSGRVSQNVPGSARRASSSSANASTNSAGRCSARRRSRSSDSRAATTGASSTKR